jgi:CBS domain-containing protein
VVGIGSGESLRAACKLLADDDIGALAVFNGANAVGLLSERDIVRALADEADLVDTSVKEYMTEAPITVRENDAVGEAVAKMNEFGVRHVLVSDGEEITGMVSMRDLVRLVGSHWPEI